MLDLKKRTKMPRKTLKYNILEKTIQVLIDTEQESNSIELTGYRQSETQKNDNWYVNAISYFENFYYFMQKLFDFRKESKHTEWLVRFDKTRVYYINFKSNLFSFLNKCESIDENNKHKYNATILENAFKERKNHSATGHKTKEIKETNIY